MWELFTIAMGVWISFAVHFIFQAEFRKMAAAGLPIDIDSQPMFVASKALCIAALVNIAVFLVMLALRSGWLTALGIVVGSYAASLLFVRIGRDTVFGTHLAYFYRLAWLSIPMFSIMLWVRMPSA